MISSQNARRLEVMWASSPVPVPAPQRWLPVSDLVGALRAEGGVDAVARFLEIVGPDRCAEIVCALVDGDEPEVAEVVSVAVVDQR